MTLPSSWPLTSPIQRAAERLKDSAANILVVRRIAGWFASRPRRSMTMAERLGFNPNARLLIINADDFGLCREQNLATIEGLQSGALTSASVMVPCEGFAEVCNYAQAHPVVDLGIHLTLTSEWEGKRWGPVLDKERVPSLTDAKGYFWRSSAEMLSRAQVDQAEAELRAQIESALAAGLDITHLDTHMFILNGGRKDLQHLYLRLGSDYSLPLRTAPRMLMHWYGFQADPEEVESFGILHPDSFAVLSRVRPSRAVVFWTSLLRNLPPGLTEICCHPAYAQGELACFADDAPQREADFRFFTSEHARQIVESHGIQLVGYRLLREAMRCHRLEPNARDVPCGVGIE